MRLIAKLAASGLRRLEVTSFVRGDVIPQLSDAEAVLEAIERPTRSRVLGVLIPNRRGLERALDRRDRFDEVNVFLSASESTTAERQSDDRRVAARAFDRSLEQPLPRIFAARGYLSRPSGARTRARFCRARCSRSPSAREAGGEEARRRHDRDGAILARCGEFFARVALLDVELTAHFHNTRGQGLANVLAALEARRRLVRVGLRRAGRLPGAPGRDREHLDRGPRLDARGDGAATGVDWAAGRRFARDAGKPGPTPRDKHLLTAGPVEWRR